MKNLFHYIVVSVFSVFALSGCGGAGGGESVFQTVTLTAATTDVNLDSDVAQHSLPVTDANFCVFGADSITVNDDTEDVTITSTLIPNLPTGIDGSTVTITQVAVTYTPADQVTPKMDTQYYTVNQVVGPGGSITVPVTVVRKSMKTSEPLVALQCTNTEYRYYVAFTFTATETNSKVTQTVQATMNLNVSDFIDK